MPKAKKRAAARRAGSARASSRNTRNRSGSQDAIALLKADHRQVEVWFEQFKNTASSSRKEALAAKICSALTAHTAIEEEIFYPAFLEATEEEDVHHEAEVEHQGAKNLIAQIEASDAGDDYYDARVTVLSEMIKHHVNEEEKRSGMFAKARQSEMDLKALGERLAARKAQIMSGESHEEETGTRSRRSSTGREASLQAYVRRVRE
jgi:hemerythrin superfamily protein